MASVNSSSGINSIYNSLGIKNTGIGGLVSGLDTDSLVEALTSGTRAKIAKQGQQKQLLNWQMTAYRGVRSTLNAFKNTNFSLAGKPTIISNTFFRTYKGSSTDSSVANLVSGSTSTVGSITVSEVKQLATAETLTVNNKFTETLIGRDVDFDTATFAGKTLNLQLDSNQSKTIRLDSLDNFSAADRPAELQRLVDVAIGKRTAQSTDPEYDTAPNAVQPQVSIVKVKVTAAGAGLSNIELTSANNRVTVTTDNAQDVLGLKKDQTNRVNLSSKLGNISYFDSAFADLDGDSFSIKINGTTITLDKTKDSLSTMMTKINNSPAGVRVSYNTASEQFTFTATNTGTGENIVMQDVKGAFLQTFTGARGRSEFTSNGEFALGYGDKITGTANQNIAGLLQDLETAGGSAKLQVTIAGKTHIIEITGIAEDVDEHGVKQGTWLKGKSAAETWKYALDTGITSYFGKGTGVSVTVEDKGAGLGTVTINAPKNTEVFISDVPSGSLGGTDTDIALGLGIKDKTNDEGAATSTSLSALFKNPDTGVVTTSGEFTINGKTIQWGGSTGINNLRELVAKVNAEVPGENIMSVDGEGHVIINSGTGDLWFDDVPGGTNLKNLFGVGHHDGKAAAAGSIATRKEGQNAEIVVNGKVIPSHSNVFTIDNIAFEVSKVSTTAVTITSASDADELISGIKSFVDDYNTLITALNTLVNESKVSGYTPLTDEQKAEMSSDQIKTWETEAQKGILKNDTTLRGIISDLRNTMTQKVEAAGISLYDIGITTESLTAGSVNYNNSGKLTVNEDRLRKAIETQPDAVRLLFTSTDEKDLGIAQRMNNVINRAVAENSDPKVRGTLVTLAGTDVLTADNTSVLGKKIEDIDDYISTLKLRLQAEYTRHWSKFTALETAIQRMSAQSSWLTQSAG